MDAPSISDAQEQLVSIAAESVELVGELVVPHEAAAIVVFAHASSHSRLSTRNRYIAHVLRLSKLATLLVELLTPEEEAIDIRTTEFRFNIDRLASRLVSVTDWLTQQAEMAAFKVGYFGDNTAAAAALLAAAERPMTVGAIVSRNGRPDLAESVLSYVQAPVLLIVGGNDAALVESNQAALKQLRSIKHLEIIPGALHLFEEPGALEAVAYSGSQWFQRYLTSSEPPQPPAAIEQ